MVTAMNDIILEQEEYKGYTINIFPDPFPMDPRDDSNLGHMVCLHKHYQLGDPHVFYDADEIYKFLEEENCIYLNLYLYDHGGVTMSAAPFSCPWDSGQVGVIYVTREDALNEYGYKKLTKNLKNHVENVLHAEVEEYDKYLKGEFCEFQILDQEGEIIDRGRDDMGYALEEAKSIVDYTVEQEQRKHDELEEERKNRDFN